MAAYSRSAKVDARARRAWITPEVRALQAGSAEAGPNPNIGEGAFARGS